MAKFITFTKEILSEQVIGTLREIGRVIGVKSPSTQNKEELIEAIMDVQQNKVAPVWGTKGARVKTKINLSAFIVDDEEDESKANEEKKEDKPIDPDKIPYSEYVKNFGSSEYVFRDSQVLFPVEGIFEQLEAGYGFIRTKNYEMSSNDVHVSGHVIKKYQLKSGDKVKARAKVIKEGSAPSAFVVTEINDAFPDYILGRDDFDSLIPCYPKRRFNFGLSEDLSLRCIDLFAPIGKGQRGLIVAPPKAGKTTLVKKLAKCIEKKNPEVNLFVLLIDERPEEVTDIIENVDAEVVYSTFDQKPEHHIRAAELVIERAKRMAEFGASVVILLDSITRLTKAYNNTIESSGKTLTGGIDPVALQMAKKLFGSARNTKGNGNITILATAMVDTGSKMDDVIYEEFKSTGNMEIHLSRELSERRIFPAIDLKKTGTRNEELLLSEEELDAVYRIRKLLGGSADQTSALLEMLKKTKDNSELLSKSEAWTKLLDK
ncbi:MAG: transcription termination factor Rho [Clostridia bacterium]|nr:transcription termination factor Rho [Clostridia bacterium]